MNKFFTNCSLVSCRFGATLAFFLFLFAGVGTVSAQHYYVATTGDDNSPTPTNPATPWRTIQKAGNTISAGATIHVASGTYSEIVTTSKNGTSSAYIRFVSDTKWGAKVIPPDGWNPQYGRVWTNTGNYVIVEGFDISAPNSNQAQIGLYNVNGAHVRLLNNHVHHIKMDNTEDNGGGGIVTGEYHNTNVTISGNLVHDCGDLEIPDMQKHGIYFSHPNGVIANNIVYRSSGFGIHFYHNVVDVLTVNNLVFSGNYGIGGHGTNMTFRNNIVLDNLTQSFYGTGWTLDNNLTSNPGMVNYKTDGTGDYHLTSRATAAIDKGSSNGAPSTDFDGNSRPRGSGYDIGPYESSLKTLSSVDAGNLRSLNRTQTGIDLSKWMLLGAGEIEIDKKENAFKLLEANNSKGVVLLSHKQYSGDLNISFDVKPLQFEGVCVVFFSATSSNGESIRIPENYDGNSDFWISANSEVKSYAIAFHTGYHQPNILAKKNPGWKSLGEVKDVVTGEKWFKIDIIKKGNLITLKVNGNIVLESKDESRELLKKGQIGLRLRGPGDGSFAVLYKNLVISK